MEGDVITLQDLFTFDFAAGRDETGRFRGQLVEHRPAPQVHRRTSHDQGVDLPTDACSSDGLDERGRRHRAWPGSVLRRPRALVAARRRRRPRHAADAVVASLERPARPTATVNGDLTVPRRRRPGRRRPRVRSRSRSAARRRRSTRAAGRAAAALHDARHRHERVDGDRGMATVRAAVTQFLAERPARTSRSVSCRSPSTSGVDVAPTTDHAAVQAAVDEPARPRVRPRSTTASRIAVEALGTKGERSIVLLSDGGDTVGEIEGRRRRREQQAQGGPHGDPRQGARRGRRLQEPRDQQRRCSSSFAAAGGGSVAAAEQPCGASRAPSPPPPAPWQSQVSLTSRSPPGVTGIQDVAAARDGQRQAVHRGRHRRPRRGRARRRPRRPHGRRPRGSSAVPAVEAAAARRTPRSWAPCPRGRSWLPLPVAIALACCSSGCSSSSPRSCRPPSGRSARSGWRRSSSTARGRARGRETGARRASPAAIAEQLVQHG